MINVKLPGELQVQVIICTTSIYRPHLSQRSEGNLSYLLSNGLLSLSYPLMMVEIGDWF